MRILQLLVTALQVIGHLTNGSAVSRADAPIMVALMSLLEKVELQWRLIGALAVR